MIRNSKFRPLLLTSAPPPLIAKTDAAFAEIDVLREAFGATLIHLHPFRNSAWRFPNLALGITRIPAILGAAKTAGIVNIFHPAPFDFPIAKLLRKPMVFTITASIKPGIGDEDLSFLKRMDAVIVSNARDKLRLHHAGIDDVFEIRPGLNLAPFAEGKSQISRNNPGRLTLLSASAPWSPRQFDSKGISALLDAAELDETLDLIIVMRGRLVSELRAMIANRKIENRVRVLDGYQDIRRLVAKADLVILMVKDPTVIKAWPHSLLEGLAGGKPVITSNQIPMSDFVAQQECGLVADNVSAEALLNSITAFRRNKADYDDAAHRFDWRAFSTQTMLEQYASVYQKVLEKSG